MAFGARVAGVILGAVANSLGITNAVVATNPPASAPKSFHWESSWKGCLAPYVVDTGVIKADGALVADAEAAWVAGPWTVQTEYLRSWVRQDTGAVPGFDGFYVSASWFLTGESRPYDPETGAFARVIPRRDFRPGEGGWGAWELAARYSFLDLNSEGVQGGRLSMLTTGVNWHLHSHVKWRFDYGFGRVSDRQPAGGFHIFQSRLEIDF